MLIFFLTIGLGFAFPFFIDWYFPQGTENYPQAWKLDDYIQRGDGVCSPLYCLHPVKNPFVAN